jgi:transposase
MSKPMADTPKRRRPRRQFTEEFKAGAVRLVLDEGKTVGAVARELDLTPSALADWVRKAQADRTQGRTGLTGLEREELARLRKEVRELRMEREVLKKAAVDSGRRCNAMNDRRDHATRATIEDDRGRQGRNLGAMEARRIAERDWPGHQPHSRCGLPRRAGTWRCSTSASPSLHEGADGW